MKPNSFDRAEFPTGEYQLSKITIDAYGTNQEYGKGR